VGSITYHDSTYTVKDLVNRYQEGALNLNPEFQRLSVWGEVDRRKLIESIVLGYPLPAIFVHKRTDNGRLVYSVIDGKQRIESILRFMGLIRGHRFSVKLRFSGDEGPELYDWRKIRRKRLQHHLDGYKLQVIEVDGDLADIATIFVRINSTGKPLTSAEKRHARYFKGSALLTEASRLAKRLERPLKQHRVISEAQVSRMLDIELMCELMLSTHQGSVINKKAALDKVMRSGDLTERQTKIASQRVYTAVKRTFSIFPNLRNTRFVKLPDFYSLVFAVATMDRNSLILTNLKRNRLADDLLAAFSVGVDHVRQQQREARGAEQEFEPYREYLLTVMEGSDKQENRQRRHDTLFSLFSTLFESRDSSRSFTPEQRRILWNSSSDRICTTPGCKKILSWEDFTIDHIRPWSKGGRSGLKNAAICCRSCNSRKGNRRLRNRAG
jgi:hypothetical protein